MQPHDSWQNQLAKAVLCSYSYIHLMTKLILSGNYIVLMPAFILGWI